MLVTSKGNYRFHRGNIPAIVGAGQSAVYIATEEVLVRPTVAGETLEIPDWVRDDAYFALVAKDGNIQEVTVPNAPHPKLNPTQAEIDAAARDAAAKNANVGLTAGEIKPAIATTATYQATDKDVAFLQSRGYQSKTVEQASAYVNKFSAADLASYKADLANWTPPLKAGTFNTTAQKTADAAQNAADTAQGKADAATGSAKPAAQDKADAAQDKADAAQGKADAAK